MLEALVAQHRSVLQKANLLRPVTDEVAREVEPLQRPQAPLEPATRDRHERFVQRPRDLAQRHHAVAGQVVDAGLRTKHPLDDDRHDVFVPDEHKRRGRIGEAEHERLAEHRRDLIGDRSPEDRARSKHELLELRVLASIALEHLLDQALMTRVGELFVAADRAVLGEQRIVVGVISVGRAAARDDQLADAGGDTRFEHVLRALDVDRVLHRPRRFALWADDGGQVHDRVDFVSQQYGLQSIIAHVPGQVRHTLDRRTRWAHVGRDDHASGSTISGQAFCNQTSDVAGAASDQYPWSPHLPGSPCMSLNVFRFGAHMCFTGSTSTWMTAHFFDANDRSIAPRSPLASATRSPWAPMARAS